MKSFILVILALHILLHSLLAHPLIANQDKVYEDKRQRTDQGTAEILMLFKNIETVIRSNSVGSIHPYFNSIVSIMIRSTEKGSYSAHQTAAILSMYFKDRRVTSFDFTKIQSESSTPFATGRLSVLYKGNQESAQVYVSLVKRDDRWMISQFNIY